MHHTRAARLRRLVVGTAVLLFLPLWLGWQCLGGRFSSTPRPEPEVRDGLVVIRRPPPPPPSTSPGTVALVLGGVLSVMGAVAGVLVGRELLWPPPDDDPG